VVWIRGMLGRPPAESFRLWSHFSRITAALTSDRVPVPATSRGRHPNLIDGMQENAFWVAVFTPRVATDEASC